MLSLYVSKKIFNFILFSLKIKQMNLNNTIKQIQTINEKNLVQHLEIEIIFKSKMVRNIITITLHGEGTILSIIKAFQKVEVLDLDSLKASKG